MTRLEHLAEGARGKSYGEGHSPSVVDRFGVWLSARQIRRCAPQFQGKLIGDFGCSSHAAFARTVLDQARSVVLADVSPDLIAHPKFTALQGVIPDMLSDLASGSLDVILCISWSIHGTPCARWRNFGDCSRPEAFVT